MVQLQEELIQEMLKDVIDPELGVNIVDLGLVYGVNISESNDVEVVMTLTSMGCPLGPVITGEVSRALSGLLGIGETSVKIVWSPPWTPDKMKKAMKNPEPIDVDLVTTVPVRLVYQTAAVGLDGSITWYGDVYGRDRYLEQALNTGYPYPAKPTPLQQLTRAPKKN